MSGCPEHWLSNHKLKWRQSAPYDHNARPFQTDRQSGRRTNIMAIARRFVLTNASVLKIYTATELLHKNPNLLHDASFDKAYDVLL